MGHKDVFRKKDLRNALFPLLVFLGLSEEGQVIQCDLAYKRLYHIMSWWIITPNKFSLLLFFSGIRKYIMTTNEIKSSTGTDCIFCKIVSKEIPSSIVYEDDKFFAFLDNNPVVKGHSLLIPKEHYVWMHETPDELIAETFITAKKIMNLMIKVIGCDYVQLVVIGKDVPHLHVHLMPRYLNDNLPQLKNIQYENDEEIKTFASKIKNTP